MMQLELNEYEPRPISFSLEPDQLALLEKAHVDVTPSANIGETCVLKASSYVGAITLGNLAIVVRPKIPIDRLMFLVAYAMDSNDWLQYPFDLSPDAEVLEAIIPAFLHHTRLAIQRGLLQWYRPEEAALHAVRGQIRFADQINRRFGIPLPVEVSYDEFTEDIEENRLLKTALYRLAHMPVRSSPARCKVRSLLPAFNTVELGRYRRGTTPEVRYTRPNRHYRPAVELARLIVDNSSLELFHGEVTGSSFLLDMNRVFERFLFVALREALDLPTREWRKQRLTLDEADAMDLYPDLSWWQAGRCRFVGDSKYKRIEPTGFRHADIYQMLAYCTAAQLPSGLLIYAAGESKPLLHRIKHAGKTIEVASINLQGSPEEILAEVGRLAERVRSHAFHAC